VFWDGVVGLAHGYISLEGAIISELIERLQKDKQDSYTTAIHAESELGFKSLG
jgi:hypothetical protein